MLCYYGCGQKAIYQFKNGKWCCSKVPQQCPYLCKKNSERQKNNPIVPYNKGKIGLYKHSKITKKKMSENRSGKKHPLYGKHHSKETKKKIGLGNKGKIISKETREKLRISNTGKKHSIKTIQNIIKCNKKRKGTRYLTISKIKERYPTFSKIEEMRYNPNKPGEKEIQVHCKNHLCKNSKEQSGWFDVGKWQLSDRIRALESINGTDGSYFYCCVECKQECPLYSLRSDLFIHKEKLYTYKEYQTWRTTVLERVDYLCEYCEEPATDVHHSRPQKLEPGFVLDPDFGVACCESCHYKYGHKTGTECSTGNLANKECL